MIRYIKIYQKLITFSISGMMAYRSNFYNSLLSSFVWSTFTLIFTLIITARTKSVFGWTPSEILILTGSYTIVWGIFNMCFSRNFDNFFFLVDNGSLDTLLLKPLDSQFIVTTQRFNVAAFIRIPLGLAILFFSLNKIHVYPSLSSIALYIFLIGCGVVLTYSLWMVIMTLILWFDRLSNLVDVMYDVTAMARYPKEMYVKVGTYFIYALPIILVSSIPSKALIQKIAMGDVAQMVLSSIVFFIFARAFWHYALSSYTSANS